MTDIKGLKSEIDTPKKRCDKIFQLMVKIPIM